MKLLRTAGARLLRLEFAVRMRRLGAWPWIALVLWSLFAAGQEPRLLRGFGIQLTWQATWSGATILLVALVLLGPPAIGPSQGLRYSANKVLVGVGLVGAVGLAQALVAWLADLVTGAPQPLAVAWSAAAGFALVWAPAAIAGVLLTGGRAPIAAIVLTGAAVIFSLGASALWFTQPTASTVAACGLAAVGAGCVGALSLPAAAAARETPR